MKTKKRHVRWSREDCSTAVPQQASSPHWELSKAPRERCCFLSGVSPAQDDLILSLSLKSLCICCQSTLKILWKSQDTLARIFFVNAAKNRTVPSWEIHSPWRCWEAVWTRRVFSKEHPLLRAVGWPHVIVSVTGGPTSCHCEESRQNDSVLSVYWQVDRAIVITGRSITSYEGQLNNTTFRSIRKTYACHNWWLTDIYYCIWDIIHQKCIKRTTSVHCFKNRQIHNMLSLLTDGPTAWHHANQWLNPMLLNQGTASNTMLSDWNQVDQCQCIKLGQEHQHQETH